MRKLRHIFSKSPASVGPTAGAFYNLWGAVARFSAEVQKSEFMKEMMRRRDAHGGHRMMSEIDCAVLYGLARWHRPSTVVESGGYLGISSAFILKALADEGVTDAKVYSIEMDRECAHGALIPDELRDPFVPLSGSVEEFVKRNELPSPIDMFLHDSSHRRSHMLWEFREFWKRLRDGGLLVSHDVHFNSAFPEFVVKTYAHDKHGILDGERTRHHEWGRWGYVGFVIKNDRSPV